MLPWLVAVAFFMEALDSTILNTAVPAIARALGVAPLSMKAVLASYTLSLAVFIPVSGWVAKRYGTRRVFACAIGLFTLGSLLCGLSGSIRVLVACRILQGCGGAMMLPVGRLTMVRTFAKSEYMRALSFVAIPGLIGPMLGSDHRRLPDRIFSLERDFLREHSDRARRGCGWCTATCPTTARSSNARSTGSASCCSAPALRCSPTCSKCSASTRYVAQILGLLLLSAVLLGAYGLNSARIAYPMLQLGLFRLRTFRASNVGSFVTRIGLGGIPFLLPLLYQVGSATTRSSPAC